MKRALVVVPILAVLAVLAATGLGSQPVGAATVPGAPSVTSVTSGVGQIHVAYAAPANDGASAITGYQATCSSSDGGVTKSSTVGLVNPLVVASLSAGHTYTCTVVAKNAVGTSAASTPSAPVFVPTVPGPPTGISATPGLIHKIYVAYTAPTNNGGSPITGSKATCTSSNGGVTASSAVSLANPLVVGSLSAGHTYTCTVVAKNAVGTSSFSAQSAAVVVFTVPGQPTVSSVTPGFHTIQVAYTPPASNGGSPITAYKATCTSSNGGVTKSATGLANPLVVAALSGNATYTCAVVATNGAGTGTASAASSAAVLVTGGFNQPVLATPSGYSASNLLMDDRFQGTSLNPAIWSHVMGGPVPDVGAWGTYTGTPVVNNGLTLTYANGTMAMVDTANPSTGKNLFTFPATGFYLQVNFKVSDMSNGFRPAIWFPYDDGIHPNANEIDMFEGGFLGGACPTAATVNDCLEFNYGGAAYEDSSWEQGFYNVGSNITQNFVTMGVEFVPGKHVNFYVGQGANRTLMLSDTNTSNIGAFADYNLVMTPQGVPTDSVGYHVQGVGTGKMYIAEVQVYSLPS
jgi:hypothetical protein